MKTENTITKKHQVILLPTDQNSRLSIKSNGDFHYEDDPSGMLNSCKGQHLYFISDEPIKERDNIYNTVQKTIFVADEQFMKLIGNSLSTNKKIIATTNPDFWQIYGPDRGPAIPKIDTTFIEAYVREQGKINTVLLEYEEDYFDGELKFMYYKLKLKSNGSVTIHPVKEKMYSKEEVEKLLNNYGIDMLIACQLKKAIPYCGDWLKQNL